MVDGVNGAVLSYHTLSNVDPSSINFDACNFCFFCKSFIKPHWKLLSFKKKNILTGSISKDLVESAHEIAQIRRSHEPTKKVGSVDNVAKQDGLELGR